MQSNVKNENMGNEYGNVNIRNVRKLMLGMLESFDRWNVRGECGNGGMLGVNVLIGAMLGANVGMLGVNVLICAMLGVNVEIGKC